MLCGWLLAPETTTVDSQRTPRVELDDGDVVGTGFGVVANARVALDCSAADQNKAWARVLCSREQSQA